MKHCEFKKGIFIQRTCGNPSYHSCKECHTPVCSNHAQAIEDSANEVLCHGCYLAQNQIDESQARVKYLKSDSNFSLWYSSYRLEHVKTRRNFLFDENDYGEFDINYTNEQVYLDNEPDFFDS